MLSCRGWVEKGGGQKGGGQKKWEPEGWEPKVGAERWEFEGWGPEGWRAQNFALFFPSPPQNSFFSSISGGSSRGFLVVFEAPGHSNKSVLAKVGHTTKTLTLAKVGLAKVGLAEVGLAKVGHA